MFAYDRRSDLMSEGRVFQISGEVNVVPMMLDSKRKQSQTFWTAL